ncbi:ABC transporter permease [Halobaculum sp. MBLA0143]|uniref:ABC transporter permease n=1 Tax=Halobaculum sp. MBLA0143 TaxID=3079933 RepID=UPI0035250FEF
MSTLDSESLRRAATVAAPETERDREHRRIALLSLPFLALATFGAFVPLAEMLRVSTSTSSFAVEGFTLSAYRELFASMLAFVPIVGDALVPEASAVYGSVIWNSLWFGAVTTVVSVAVGVGLAHSLEKYDLPFEGTLVTLLSFPISLPGIVAAFMMIVLFGTTGVLSNALAFLVGTNPDAVALTGQPSGSPAAVLGLFFGYLYSMIPRATFLLRGTYAEVNRDAEEAARALGASPLETFRHVTLPQIRPGVVAALILTFRTALAIFGTVLVLKALSVVTFRFDQEIQVGFDLPMASALAVVFFAFTLAFTFLGLRFTSAEVGEA